MCRLARLSRTAVRWRLWMLSACLILITGCEEQRGPSHAGQGISISIRMDGKPVTEGQVDLSGPGGGAALNGEGLAQFKHVPFGEYRVMVIPPQPDAIPREPGAGGPESPKIKIPRQFQAEETTPLSIFVEAGQPTTFEFDLKP